MSSVYLALPLIESIDGTQIKSYTEALNAIGNVTGATNINMALANVQTLTLTGSATLSFINTPATGQSFSMTFFITQGGAGSYTITWPGSVSWPGGASPTLSTSVGDLDIISFVTLDGGTNWRGFVGGLGY